MLKRLVVNTLVFGLAPNIPKLASILVLPILTLYLTDLDFGIAGTIAAYTGLIGAFSTLGLTIVLGNSFFHYPLRYKWIWRQIYGFLYIWMFVFALIQSCILYFLIPLEAQDNRIWIIVLTNLPIVFFGATATIGSMHYVLLQKSIPVAIRSVIAGLITIACNLLFVVHYKMGYMGWYASGLISTIVLNVSYWNVVNRDWGMSPIFNFKWRTIKKCLEISLPGIPHFYSVYLLNTSSRLLMDQYKIPMSEIGKFSLAQNFGNYFDMFVMALNTAINPIAMAQIKDAKEEVARTIIYTAQGIVLLATFFFCLWSKEIFSILIQNPTLAKTYPIVIILIMGYNYRPMYIASSNIFFYHEKTKALLKVSFAAGVMSFMGYAFVIPIWGIQGVSIVNYIFLMYMGFAGFLMTEFKNNSQVKYQFKTIFLVIIAVTVCAFYAVECSWSVKIGLSNLALLITLGALWWYVKRNKVLDIIKRMK